jgi:hypothetical protein
MGAESSSSSSIARPQGLAVPEVHVSDGYESTVNSDVELGVRMRLAAAAAVRPLANTAVAAAVAAAVAGECCAGSEASLVINE